MASIINASTSGAGGLISTADASGELQLQTASTLAVKVDSSQNVVIGIGDTPSGVSGDRLRVVGQSGPNSNITQARYSDNSTAVYLKHFKARGTIASPATIQNGDVLGVYLVNAYDGTAFREVGALQVSSDGAISTGIIPTAAVMYTMDSTGTSKARFAAFANGMFAFDSGYGSAATAYGCRAWVNFNGEGTVAIRASGNVSSITDNGVGNYTVNFTTAMPDANYSVGFGASGSSSVVSDTIGGPYLYSTSSFLVNTRGGNNAQADRSIISCVIIR